MPDATSDEKLVLAAPVDFIDTSAVEHACARVFSEATASFAVPWDFDSAALIAATVAFNWLMEAAVETEADLLDEARSDSWD